VFERFVKKSAITVMAGGIAARMLHPALLDEWFEKTSRDQYTRELLFSTIFDLMSQVVCGIYPSVNAAYQAMEEEIPISIANSGRKSDINLWADAYFGLRPRCPRRFDGRRFPSLQSGAFLGGSLRGRGFSFGIVFFGFTSSSLVGVLRFVIRLLFVFSPSIFCSFC
jgi:hypothetical protein